MPSRRAFTNHAAELIGVLVGHRLGFDKGPLLMQPLKEEIVRFVETGTYSQLSNTHFGCPLGLGNHHAESTHAERARNVRRMLEHGAVYYGHYYDREPAAWNFTEVMFPITPVELGEGMVLGSERIRTAQSGRFGWPDGSAADAYLIDAQGNRVEQPNVTEVTENGRRLYELRMPSDHFAILVRRSFVDTSHLGHTFH